MKNDVTALKYVRTKVCEPIKRTRYLKRCGTKSKVTMFLEAYTNPRDVGKMSRGAVEVGTVDIYAQIDLLVAVALAVASLVSAGPPVKQQSTFRQAQIEGSAPYEARGWRPSGPQFNLPQKQVAAPRDAYGPPQEYGPPPTEPEPTTTETTIETTTEYNSLNIKSENIALPPKNEKQSEPADDNAPTAPLYVILPQSRPQRLVQLLEEPVVLQKVQRFQTAGPGLAPVQAVPALAKIQQAPVVLEDVRRVQQVVQLQRIRAPSAASLTQVVTPYSSSFVQVYQ